MSKLFFFALTIFIFSACSFKTPPNEWQYKSVNAFNSYTKNFLSANDGFAKNDLSKALSYAKSSADLTSLARVYLGECALNISVGLKDGCQKYLNVSETLNDESLNAYYSFLTSSITQNQINLLPKNYQKFAQHLKNSKIDKANSTVLEIKEATSKILAAALIKEKIDDNTINEIIKTASFYGYKKVVLFWLNEKKERTSDIGEKNIIIKKISILNSSN